MKSRHTLRRIHVWLGWIVGVPLLFWTVSGFLMVLRPIDTVRGSDLRNPPAALALPPLITQPYAAAPFRTLTVEPQGGGAVWIATFGDRARRADLATGHWLPPVSALEAQALAAAAYRPHVAVATVTRTPGDRPPLDLRKARPAWRVAFADGTHLYIDADTGQVLALRTRWWRIYDWMWGLHIMDLRGRENTSHPLLIGFAGVALLTTLLALVLLPLASRRRRYRKGRGRADGKPS